tara:strand:- start:1631 stop:1933 length:303 start_codon:yes stop_codon:yes gene_type:complete
MVDAAEWSARLRATPPPGLSAFLDARKHIALERADDTDVEEALRLYRANPDECLYHMCRTEGFWRWNLARHEGWKAEFPEAAKRFHPQLGLAREERRSGA